MNSNTFQDNPSTTSDGAVSYKFGSLANSTRARARRPIEHNHYVIDLGVELGSKAHHRVAGRRHEPPRPGELPGPVRAGARRPARQIYAHLPDDWELYTEHKPYEPAFYSSVNNDWGTSLLLAQGTGERAKCLVDLGHHLPNTNIEQVVSRLAMVGRLGGFHFNDSKYGDDDLTVGSITPFQLFLICCELLEAGGGPMPDARLHDRREPQPQGPARGPASRRPTRSRSRWPRRCASTAPTLADAQEANDPARAAEVLHRAFRTDVRPLVAEARRRNGAALDPLATYRAVGYRGGDGRRARAPTPWPPVCRSTRPAE